MCWLLCLQARVDKERHSRRLMIDNTYLLADLAELQHSHRELTHKLGAATRQLAALQLQQEQAASSAAQQEGGGSRPSSGRLAASLQPAGATALK